MTFLLFATLLYFLPSIIGAQQAGLRRDIGGEPVVRVDGDRLDHRADLGVRGGDEAAAGVGGPGGGRYCCQCGT